MTLCQRPSVSWNAAFFRSQGPYQSSLILLSSPQMPSMRKYKPLQPRPEDVLGFIRPIFSKDATPRLNANLKHSPSVRRSPSSGMESSPSATWRSTLPRYSFSCAQRSSPGPTPGPGASAPCSPRPPSSSRGGRKRASSGLSSSPR